MMCLLSGYLELAITLSFRITCAYCLAGVRKSQIHVRMEIISTRRDFNEVFI